MTNYPAISVIIPMYNAEDYIAECLESIFMQTFQDYEVIVVDDCSTDNCCVVVESYAEKFSGRLKLSHMEKNSGSGALPRNKGVMLARGEYVFFLDSDDMITKTALEEIYTLAKNYEADVVYCEKDLEIKAGDSNIYVGVRQLGNFVKEPCLETEDLAQRVYKILNGEFSYSTCFKTVRRDFMIANEIFFPHVCPSEDDIWTHGLIFHAKKFLRVPNIVYIRRLTEGSVMRRKKTPAQEINFWLNPLINGLKSLDNLMDKIEFFQRNPQYRCAILKNFIYIRFSCIIEASCKLQLPEIYAAIKGKYGKKLGENDVLLSFLLADLIQQQKIFAEMRERIAELEKNK